jgi:hypothetical protein
MPRSPPSLNTQHWCRVRKPTHLPHGENRAALHAVRGVSAEKLIEGRADAFPQEFDLRRLYPILWEEG